jgi:hypothetical protein
MYLRHKVVAWVLKFSTLVNIQKLLRRSPRRSKSTVGWIISAQWTNLQRRANKGFFRSGSFKEPEWSFLLTVDTTINAHADTHGRDLFCLLIYFLCLAKKIRTYVCMYLRLHFIAFLISPLWGKMWPPGVKLTPRGEGWRPSVRPSVLQKS